MACHPLTHRYLIVASETPDEREARRRHVGAASDETYADTLRALDAGCECRSVSCVDGSPVPDIEEFRAFDGIVFSGSPIAMHEETPETRAAASFMTKVLASGVPALGSCAGLQIAVVAAGGRVKPRDPHAAAGFTRGIVATQAGRHHPLLTGRPVSWDAPALHFDETAELPPGATVLAEGRTTRVQALEIRQGEGCFWGVQYHPELTLEEIAASLRRQADTLVEAGLARDQREAAQQAQRIEILGREPDRLDLAWMLGIDQEVTDPGRRMREIANFLRFIRDRRQSS